MERDEVFVPKTREDFKIPKEIHGEKIDYREMLADTPIYTLCMLIRQQLLAFPAYFHHGAAATEHLKAFLGDHYQYSDKPAFKALWDNYNKCQFVDDAGALSADPGHA
ncbi:hypothetical protein H0H87_012190 [Tephrocybe sp. NHM501043]|nr:hypothetical protein H0H87_012190 [Tephrocybe sp. NHM501043]